MRRAMAIVLSAVLFLGGFTATVLAESGQEGHQGEGQPSGSGLEMMIKQMIPHITRMMERSGEEKGHMMGGMAWKQEKPSLAMNLEMMTGMLAGRAKMSPGMMRDMMDRTFFLDGLRNSASRPNR